MTRYEQTDPHIYYTPRLDRLRSHLGLGRQLQLLERDQRRGHHLLQRHPPGRGGDEGDDDRVADFFVDGVKTDTINLARHRRHLQRQGLHHRRPAHADPTKWRSSTPRPTPPGKRITLDAVEVAGELTYAVPMITGVTPNTGFTLGGDTVVITGANSQRRHLGHLRRDTRRQHHRRTPPPRSPRSLPLMAPAPCRCR